MNLEKLFLDYCKTNNFEVNKNQISVIQALNDYYIDNFNQSFLKKFLKKNKCKYGFYLSGDVGVGKTMLLNFFFELLKVKKLRLHFNQFMINFHDFIYENKNSDKNDGIEYFVKNLKKKVEILYFDEFQVTNIVDAMILGRLFQNIFDEKIRVIFTSNIKVNNLYKDGLQREQFLPFIDILKKQSQEIELLIDEDYRANRNKNLGRFLFPLNQSTNFKLNKFFRKVTKNKKKSLKVIDVKGRKLEFKNFYEGIFRLQFDEIFNKNLGAEDYIRIAESSNFIFLENLPNFDDNNSNQQQRFITFIDIVYEKKIPLMISSESNLYSIKSSKSLSDIFKRTTSRLYELTSISND